MPERTHDLKSVPPHFGDIASGQKTFDIRLNDRNYKVGDFLRLREFDPKIGYYTGPECRAEITSSLQGEEWGIAQNFIILSIKVREVSEPFC